MEAEYALNQNFEHSFLSRQYGRSYQPLKTVHPPESLPCLTADLSSQADNTASHCDACHCILARIHLFVSYVVLAVQSVSERHLRASEQMPRITTPPLICGP